jgi:hypothetical protein
VIVVFASSYDLSASSLVARWADYNASLLTCDDLSVTGWRDYLHSQQTSTAVVSGRVVPVEEIRGVLIRWPGVFEPELVKIAPADRGYVAREMMAFLVSWLSRLKCPVINQPTPVNLTGPAWRLEQWTYVAARLGIPVQTAKRHVSYHSDGDGQNLNPSTAIVTVVGERCFGDVEAPLLAQSSKLAKAANVSLLNVAFSGTTAGSYFAGADLMPTLSAETTEAVLELLLQKESENS